MIPESPLLMLPRSGFLASPWPSATVGPLPTLPTTLPLSWACEGDSREERQSLLFPSPQLRGLLDPWAGSEGEHRAVALGPVLKGLPHQLTSLQGPGSPQSPPGPQSCQHPASGASISVRAPDCLSRKGFQGPGVVKQALRCLALVCACM